MYYSYFLFFSIFTLSIILRGGKLKIVQFWNEICAPHGLPRARMLSALDNKNISYLNSFLTSDKEWREYFAEITKSEFLTGSNSINFKAYINWALNPENASKVLNGAYNNNPEKEKELSQWEKEFLKDDN